MHSQVQEEAARQQVPHVTGFGKVTPTGGGKMPPPVLQQRPLAGHMVGSNQNQQAQQGPNVSNMGVSGNAGVSGNLLSMDQWGNRFPSTSGGGQNAGGGQVIRTNNPMQMMQTNQMPQPVCITRRKLD